MVDLDSIYWHDGILEDIRFSATETDGDLVLQAQIYESHDAQFGVEALAGHKAPARKRLTVQFRDVAACQFTCDAKELLDNRSAGNISNGHVTAQSQPNGGGYLTFRIYLCDGYVEITAKDANVTVIS